MKRMKALLSVFLIIAMLQIFVLNSSALVAQDMFDGREEVTESSPLSSEEKLIPCDATEDDDFADDTILIVMKHNNSMELSEYDVTDFSEINHLTNIDELSKHEKEKLKNEMKTKTEKYIDKITKTTCDSMTKTKAESLARNELSTKNPQFRSILKLTLNTRDKKTVLDTIKKLELRDDILVAEPDYYVHTTALPDDYSITNQWAISNMNLPFAWNSTTGSRNVLVGVIDSGIKGDHEDLQANIYSDNSFHKSYVDNAPLVDNYWHGTHVAGIIGAVGNNNKGITGVCWKVSLVSFKITQTGYDGSTSNVINAIEDAEDLKISILNYSYSSKESLSLKQSISTYKGLFICSAGNGIDDHPKDPGVDIDSNPNNKTELYPSLFDCTNIISVASINSSNQKETKSCYGKTSVDLAAPGVSIYSTDNNGSYVFASGTSMAAPQVTGVAALINSYLPNISPMGIKRAILDNTISCSSVNGKVVTNGRLDALSAIQSADSKLNNTSYTINYDKGTGSGSNMLSKTVHYGAKATLDNNTFQAPTVGYRFIGWYAKNSSNEWEFLKPDGTIDWRPTTASCSTSTIHLYPDGANDMDGITTITKNNGTSITMVAQYEPISYHVNYDMDDLYHPTLGQMSISAVYDTEYSIVNAQTATNALQESVIIVNYNIYRNNNGNVEWLCENPNNNSQTWSLENSGFEKVTFSRSSSFSNLTTLHNDTLYLHPNWAYRGDVDYDGVITILDALKIQRYIADLEDISFDMLPVADFDEDAEVTILDATAIQIYLSNL